jgi:transglutaminase-like putative cysteine protease
MFYTVRHRTTFRYMSPVRESVMEVRMQPRSDANQRCLTFDLAVTPTARILSYRDSWGNSVHHFDIPSAHSELTLMAQGLVELQPLPSLDQLEAGGWDDLDAQVMAEDFWDMLAPSYFARPSPMLLDLAKELGVQRRGKPLDVVREINDAIMAKFQYVPNSTKVDSPIEEAISRRQGVCQDFAHITITLIRKLGIPCRYVSGYLSQRSAEKPDSMESASHAWLEAWLPGPGWIGFDPTNRLMTGEHHIRVAIGRDYADVPPTKGVFKGDADSELAVAVRVSPANAPLPEELPPASVVKRTHRQDGEAPAPAIQQGQQQQQQ